MKYMIEDLNFYLKPRVKNLSTAQATDTGGELQPTIDFRVVANSRMAISHHFYVKDGLKEFKLKNQRTGRLVHTTHYSVMNDG